jgi:hypothetical protein
MDENSEILESFCPGSRINAMLDNPIDESWDEG